ncbi:polysaccharide deacetylase family protein [Novosphingobium sp. KCTC 2891]|uniref:polysaccharide deacetylase family protein n=1 Tax=Novosphingobium sp. KCTC 2891 TaxID=2989730 RepID=UPI002222B743|nr:polysaccharide deacetylase family protein [Novosphingobium sp. KCTC 2891]MCW1381930.1 polysaccharide deacetylase family protein [Novosphingobium sp. KCTC 2891]
MLKLLTAMLASLTLLCAAPVRAASPPAGQVALTFDDLPGLSLPNQRYVDSFNHDLLTGLRRHRIAATGFVNEGKLDELDRGHQIAILKRWLQAGMDLGNHTYSHESLNTLGARPFVADIAKGEKVTGALMAARHRHLRWFRFPNLETGADTATKSFVAGWLAAHGYRSAPVTIDPDDWEFAEPYDDAVLHHDHARAAYIREAYLAHSALTIDWSRKAAHALFGRDIAYVMLLHASKLNADCIDSLTGLITRRGMHFTSLDRAMRDPAYRTPDPYVGADGIEWLERWSQALHRELPWDDFPEVPASIVTSYDKLENDRH